LAKMKSASLNLALVTDEFDADTLDENLDNDQHVDENDESSSSESDEENMQPLFDAAPDVPVGIGGEGNESNMPHSAVGLCDVPTSSRID
jgi:glutamine phosphoribosylpyrophosphate amidotransferase